MVTYSRNLIFEALADPTRREILDLLSDRDRTAGEIADRFEVSRSAVSRHLRVLREAGLVQREKAAQWRVYRLNPEALREVDRWIGRYRVFWAARLHALKRVVEDLE